MAQLDDRLIESNRDFSFACVRHLSMPRVRNAESNCFSHANSVSIASLSTAQRGASAVSVQAAAALIVFQTAILTARKNL
ncbi:hypothetical protein [Burkholderia mayonis]|uniref:hypothetical protein n=1 Tax=Burkholderia mayonis TaxID=1385591 RepID=UPI000A9B0DEA|nr:hypothetical protein [Burkholderia mayonis]